MAKYGIHKGVISRVKYDFWEKQKELLDKRGHPYKEVIYEDLKSEDEFVDKSKRGGFSPKQTEVSSRNKKINNILSLYEDGGYSKIKIGKLKCVVFKRGDIIIASKYNSHSDFFNMFTDDEIDVIIENSYKCGEDG